MVFSSWMHFCAVRVFSESILRYGLPPSFLSVVLSPSLKSEKKIRSILEGVCSSSSRTHTGKQRTKEEWLVLEATWIRILMSPSPSILFKAEGMVSENKDVLYNCIANAPSVLEATWIRILMSPSPSILCKAEGMVSENKDVCQCSLLVFTPFTSGIFSSDFRTSSFVLQESKISTD
ncbi:V-type proton ATPase subunit C [Orobanche gracilis]